MATIQRKPDRDFSELAATSVTFTGAKVQGGRLIPDTGYKLERGPDKGTIMLKDNNGTSVGGITCECGLEGGGCEAWIVNEGQIDEYAICIPSDNCGKTGLFCFMGLSLSDKFTLRFRV